MVPPQKTLTSRNRFGILMRGRQVVRPYLLWVHYGLQEDLMSADMELKVSETIADACNGLVLRSTQMRLYK